MSEHRPARKDHDVEVGSVLGGPENWFAVCSCGWSTGAPEEKGVSQEEIQRRVREHQHNPIGQGGKEAMSEGR